MEIVPSTEWAAQGKILQGIITGCDAAQEWLLPWWWWHLRQHTDLPVVFADFGMSEKGRRFCQERGEIISLPAPDFVVGREKVTDERAAQWENVFTPNFWQLRRPWYMKPLALLKSPFQRTLWLDLDCALRAPLESLFEEFQGDVALVKERGMVYNDWGILPKDAASYNTGVVLFSHGSPLIREWAERGIDENDRFLTEQILLSTMVYEGRAVELLPERYNWNMRYPGCDAIAIAHFIGGDGKEKICQEMELMERLNLL